MTTPGRVRFSLLRQIGDLIEAINVRTGRRMEWFSAMTMLGWGLLLITPNMVFEPFGIYSSLVRRGIDPVVVGAIFCIIGTAWLLALWSNGHWHRSPSIRVFGSLIGAAVWGWVATSLVVDGMRSTMVNIGTVTYVFMSLYNLDAAYSAARDMEWGRRKGAVDL